MSVALSAQITAHWPVKDPGFFQRIHHDKTKGQTVYRLNAKMLSKDECHLFWDYKKTNSRLIARALEFFTFHPLTKLNEKFNITPVTCNEYLLFICSFPKAYQGICERAAKTFHMQMVNTRMDMVGIREKENEVDSSMALTLAEDYKERRIPGKDDIEREKPVPKGALAIPVKKQLETTVIEFPEADNVLWFRGKALPEAELDRLEEEITAIGNSLHKLGLD